MISFKQFMGEAKDPPELIKILSRDCAPFLNQARGNGLLVRGIASLKTGQLTNCSVPWKLDDDIRKSRKLENGLFPCELYKKTVRTDRKPLDSSQWLHKTMDKWFYENFGYNVRSESMFAFAAHGDLEKMYDAYEDAAKYSKSDPCVVFPIGKFKYVWSEDVDDLYRAVSEAIPPLQSEEDVDRFLDYAEYTQFGLSHALKQNKREIMIKCDSYYAVDWEHIEGIAEWLGTL